MDWKQIGGDSFRAGHYLLASGRGELTRSSVSRFYYAAFAVLTKALAGTFDTSNGQETPSHKGLAKLIKRELTAIPEWKRLQVVATIRRLYSARIDADYRSRTVDRFTASNAGRDAAALFEILGVNYGD